MKEKLTLRQSTSGVIFKISIVFLIMAMVFILMLRRRGEFRVTSRAISGQMKTDV